MTVAGQVCGFPQGQSQAAALRKKRTPRYCFFSASDYWFATEGSASADRCRRSLRRFTPPPPDARLNGSRSSEARVSSERHRRRVGRSLLARSASRGFGGFTLADCRSGLCRVGVPRTARLLRVLSGSSASCPSHQLSRPTLIAGSSDGRQRGGPGGAEVTQRGPARCIARCWCDLHFVRSRDRRSDDSGPWSFAIPHRAGLTGVRRTQPVPGCSRFRPHRGAPGCLNCPGVRMAVREG